MPDFQLSQEAWNNLSSQMNEMAEANKLLKKAVKSTYNKLTNVPKQCPKKTYHNMKVSKKTEETVKITENPAKGNKDTNKTLKGKNVKNNS